MGSWGLGVPINPILSDIPDFEWVDVSKAGGKVLSCEDKRCRGTCKKPGNDHFCSPNGGTCMKYNGSDACSFSWRYGDGSSTHGLLIESEVDLGGLSVSTIYGGITKASKEFFEAPKGGGILGLSFGNYSMCTRESSCFVPLLDDLVAKGGLEERFAVCAHGDEGKLILGGRDDRLYEGELKYIPFLPPYIYYRIRVHQVTLGEEDLTASPPPTTPPNTTTNTPLRLRGAAAPGNNASSTLTALVDTGAAAIRLPEDIYGNFKASILRAVPKILQDPEINFFDKVAVNLPDHIYDSLPNLNVKIDTDLTLTFTPNEYMGEYTYKDMSPPLKVRYLRVVESDGFVLGQPALTKLYIEIDRENKVMAIAPSKPGCMPTPGAAADAS